jgi:nucleotide-binding universal stress UspA family protein
MIMFEHILFPTDGSEGATVAFDHVLDIASAHGAEVHVINVADTTQMSTTRIRGEVIDALEEEGEELIEETTDRATRRGVTTVSEVVRGEPYTTIVEYADTYEIDVIVMPTHGRRGLERFLLGSTTERVVRRANVPVLTIQPDVDGKIGYPYQNVLVPTDGSDCANQALALGVDVTNDEVATLHLLSIIAIASLGVDMRPDLQREFLEERARDLIQEARTFAEEAGIETVSGAIEYGPSIHQTILTYVDDHDIDIVVVGTHGRTGFDRYLLGSVTEYLIRTSPVPVLTVREPTQQT